jgi:hypothetical protein
VVEIVDLDIEMSGDLIKKVRNLAHRYFGDDSGASEAQVLEVAFRMRCLWSRSVKEGHLATDEAVSDWECPESPVNKENTVGIRNWLFRR